ncbi:ABC transporter ATP-binding protein [Poseidonocella sp. HB161398]|uniref:ABC transporter ATP-binding protein n=1 Tax=Poseidonocella sp. HB161398 TaxID=2320855 RepID=UPI0011090637|nr:ABC transporter ATP-binding protein [Poseidonocella sp. HB161398]
MLCIEDLTGGYGPRPVLSGVSLELAEGAALAVFGPNTAGKTSLLRAISGQLPHVSGRIRFRGEEISGLPAHARAALGIAQVPEGRHVFGGMAVEENLLCGAWTRRRQVAQSDLDECYHLFPRLRERRLQMAGSLSGGEQQMVAICRALMLRPSLLLLDEPSHGLAPLMVREVHAAISRILKTGISVLLVEQNLPADLPAIREGLLLEEGRVALAGPMAQITRDPRFREAYLGV